MSKYLLKFWDLKLPFPTNNMKKSRTHILLNHIQGTENQMHKFLDVGPLHWVKLSII